MQVGGERVVADYLVLKGAKMTPLSKQSIGFSIPLWDVQLSTYVVGLLYF